MSARVVILTKDPVPGRVKTRTVPVLGPDGAAALHRLLVAHTLAVALDSRLPVVVALDGDPAGAFAASLRSAGASVQPQGDGDLGDRLVAASTGPGRHICIGTDCPTLSPADLRDAAHRADVTVGPAEDGGYWLIALDGRPPGVDNPAHTLFRDVPWSTARVLETTLRRAEATGIPVNRLATRYDVDTPEDLLRLAADPACPPGLRLLLPA